MRTFFVAGIGVAVLIEFLLISKKNKSAADQVLTLWMFLVVVHLFLFYLYFTQDIYTYTFLLGVEQPIPLLHGVFLFLYVSFLTGQLPEKRLLLAIHFLPALAMYAYLTGFFTLPPEQKIQVYRNHGAGYELFNNIRWYATAASGIVYVAWSALLLRRHRKKIRAQFSDLERVNLRWLLTLTLGLGGIWLLVILFRSDVLVHAGAVIFVFLIGFFGVRQANIFAHGEVNAGSTQKSERAPEETLSELVPRQESAENGLAPRKKYPKSGLTEESSAKLHQRLLHLMTEEALYKKSDLSIHDLASRLGVHPNYLSQIINQKETKNFYDFVNTYRIEEFKRLIAMPRNQQFTLLSLAYDCGFSSKSSFNRYFKETTRQTPSQYFAALTRAQVVGS